MWRPVRRRLTAPDGVVVLEFPSYEQAKARYESPEY